MVRLTNLRDTLGIFPQELVFGLLPLGLPTTGLACGLHAVVLLPLELDISALNVVTGHDISRALVPDGTEDGKPNRFGLGLVSQTLKREPVPLAVQLLQLLGRDGLLVLQHKDAQTVIRRALLRKWG